MSAAGGSSESVEHQAVVELLNKPPSGLWPSEYAGVVAALNP